MTWEKEWYISKFYSVHSNSRPPQCQSSAASPRLCELNFPDTPGKASGHGRYCPVQATIVAQNCITQALPLSTFRWKFSNLSDHRLNSGEPSCCQAGSSNSQASQGSIRTVRFSNDHLTAAVARTPESTSKSNVPSILCKHSNCREKTDGTGWGRWREQIPVDLSLHLTEGAS